MDISKSSVCRICSEYREGNCSRGEMTAPYKKDECWTFKHRSEKFNMANASETNGSHNNWNS